MHFGMSTHDAVGFATFNGRTPSFVVLPFAAASAARRPGPSLRTTAAAST